MKHCLPSLAVLALSVTLLAACEGEAPPPKPAAAPKVEPASTPAAAAPVAEAPRASEVAEKAAPSSGSGQDPANARNAGARYKGGIDRMETDKDLSKVKVVESPEHEDGHDHAQDGNGLLPSVAASNLPGRIRLDEGAEQVHDFGKVRQGEVRTHEFAFVADGEGPLVITGVKPSCGCTKAEVVLLQPDGTRKVYTKGEPIPVGTHYVLESEINTDGKQGMFNAQITMYANDPRGTFTLKLTAEIEQVLTITPSSTVYFGRITTKDQKEEVVTVSTTRGEPFLLTLKQEAVQDGVKLEFAAKDPDPEGKSNEWTIKLTLGPNLEPGMRNFPIHFTSDLVVQNPKYPSPDGTPQYHGFMLNASAQVQGMVSAEPVFITFGMVRPGEQLERSLRLESHDDFKLTSDIPVTLEGLQGQEFAYKDAFRITVEPIEDGKAANLKMLLTGLPDDLNGSLGGVMRVKVGHPFMPEIEVRFSAVCRPGLPVVGGQQK